MTGAASGLNSGATSKVILVIVRSSSTLLVTLPGTKLIQLLVYEKFKLTPTAVIVV